MAQCNYYDKFHLLYILIFIPLCLLACTPGYVPLETTSLSSPKKVIITDIGRELEEHETTLIVYSNQTVDYRAIVQQAPPAIVLEVPDVYLHGNLRPMEFPDGLVSTVIPEQIESDGTVETRLTIQMSDIFPYEIIREKNQLRINIKEYPAPTTLSLAYAEESEGSEAEETTPEPEIQPSVMNQSKSSDAPRLKIPERKILRDVSSRPESETKETTLVSEPLEKLVVKPGPPSTVEAISIKKGSTEEPDEAELLLRKKVYKGKPISLDFQNADIRSVLRIVADVSGHNLVIDPEVKGKVDITLVKPVPWDQALDVILKTNKLDLKMEGNIIRVGLPQTFAAEKKAELEAIQAMRKAREEATKVLPLETRIVPINYAKAEVLMAKLQPMLSKNEGLAEPPSIMVDERTNTLIIKDLPEVIDEIIAVIDTLDRQTPQVMIEARIVETNKNYAKDLGIQWGGTYTKRTNYRFPSHVEVKGASGQEGRTLLGGLGATAREDEYAVNIPISSSPFGAIGFNLGHISGETALDIQLKAMETSGRGRIISNPRIATLDNAEATIKSGHKIPYQVTDAEGNPSTQFVDAAINLTVTPQITPDNNITMKIQADKSEPDWSRTVAGAPSIITRTATTRLIVANGETAVIGGLAQHNEQNNLRKVPFFGDLPVLKLIFSAKDSTDGFDELLIFITPRIITE